MLGVAFTDEQIVIGGMERNEGKWGFGRGMISGVRFWLVCSHVTCVFFPLDLSLGGLWVCVMGEFILMNTEKIRFMNEIESFPITILPEYLLLDTFLTSNEGFRARTTCLLSLGNEVNKLLHFYGLACLTSIDTKMI